MFEQNFSRNEKKNLYKTLRTVIEDIIVIALLKN
tara:strand:- start:11 stop:112 length:102 start_codon:yes stop_codon:yes gene_type:complete